ncbi:MAG TPA: PAS domain S-box protein [Elusimicrobiota bacterium]|nr:PAS domain S-box protein [Elusimicrobiota bacterium]
MDAWADMLGTAALFYLIVRSLAGCLQRTTHEKAAGERHYEKILSNIRTALNNSADVAVTDAEGSIIYVNDRFCRLSGYSREELLRQNHRIINSGAHSKEFFGELWDTITAGKVWRGEVCNRAKDGSLFWESTVVTPIIGDDGKPVQYVVIRHDITARALMEQELRRSEENQMLAAEAAQLGIWSSDEKDGRVEWSPLARKIMGVGPEAPASYEAYMALIHPDDREAVKREIERGFRENGRFSNEHRVVWPDGSVHWVSTTGRAYTDEQGRPARTVGVVQDVTQAKTAQERLAQIELQLRQSQKMEGIGRLAGGIAHDFNNLLTAIGGYSRFLLDGLPAGDPMRDDVTEIMKAGERAGALTRQLLAFSRRQVLLPRVLDLNAVLADLEKMLKRIIGENIDFSFLPGADLGRVKADPGQIEQVVVNLAVNAKDAMPEGGRLVIETANVVLDGDYAGTHPGCAPGPYVMLAVSDTGCGMSDEVKSRIFEPFFTTKGQGKGTGLGLATVYGIVKQSRGSIYVYSEPGRGSTFKIYLPRTGEAAENEIKRPGARAAGGSETILLVEDDALVHKFAARVLRQSGYAVLEARGPAEAIDICARSETPIDLMLTDVIMPQMHGYALAERLARLRPEMKVVFMSGYTEQLALDPALPQDVPFLQKPLAANAVLRKIRETLDAAPRSA